MTSRRDPYVIHRPAVALRRGHDARQVAKGDLVAGVDDEKVVLGLTPEPPASVRQRPLGRRYEVVSVAVQVKREQCVLYFVAKDSLLASITQSKTRVLPF